MTGGQLHNNCINCIRYNKCTLFLFLFLFSFFFVAVVFVFFFFWGGGGGGWKDGAGRHKLLQILL